MVTMLSRPTVLLAISAFVAFAPIPASVAEQEKEKDTKRSADVAGDRVALLLPKELVDSEVEDAARKGGVTAVFVTVDGDASVVVAALGQPFDEAIESVARGRIKGQEHSAVDVTVAGRAAKLYEYRQQANNRSYDRWILFIPATDKKQTIMISANLAENSDVTTTAELRRRLLAVEIRPSA